MKGFTIKIKQEDIKVRKQIAPANKVFKSKKTYTRKEKHNGRTGFEF